MCLRVSDDGSCGKSLRGRGWSGGRSGGWREGRGEGKKRRTGGWGGEGWREGGRRREEER